MDIKIIKYKDHDLRYLISQNNLYLNTKDICNILSIPNDERASTKLNNHTCDLADAGLYAALKDPDFLLFIDSTFKNFNKINRTYIEHIDEDWKIIA